MDYADQKKPQKINLDKGQKYLTAEESTFIKNHEVLQNIHNGIGQNMGMGTPTPGNFAACEIEQPAGENYSVGSYHSPLTNETYSWHYNSNGIHYIERIGAKGCEIVYHGPCLELSAEPRHSIEQWRATMRIEKVCPNRDGKYLVWTDGLNPIGYLDVEASISTNSFTTPFFDICATGCTELQMCVPDPCGCLSGEFIPLTEGQEGLSNTLLDVPIQLMYRHVYYDNRKSLWSTRSSVYYQNARGCFDNSVGASRCLKFRVPVGNPLVDRIEIAYTIDGQNWYITETVDKYTKYNNSQEKWYTRGISSSLLNFSQDDCSFDYIFCNDKEKTPVPPSEVTRVVNTMPRQPQGILEVKDSLGFFNYIDGICPIDKSEISKFDINIDCSDTTGQDCSTQYATVTARVLIHNTEENLNQYVYRQKGGSRNDPDDKADPVYFGGISVNPLRPQQLLYGQKFNGDTRDFIAYVEGTYFWGETKQWQSTANFGARTERGVISSMQNLADRNAMEFLVYNGNFFYQEVKIKVPKGSMGFVRLVSHQQTTGFGSAQDTSTQVIGTVDIRQYAGNSDITDIPSFNGYNREIYFDTCFGDVELFDSFIINDNSAAGAGGSSYSGYVRDTENAPLEGLNIRFESTSEIIAVTDHNGFYSFYKNGADNSQIELLGELNCGAFSTLQNISITGTEATNTEFDIGITSLPYKNDFYATVKLPVKDCDGQGVPGIRVALSGSKYKVTDNFGVATFKIRNFITRNRTVRAVVLNNNGCLSFDCEGECNPCMPTFNQLTPACYQGKPTIELPDAVINISGFVKGVNGLKSGGRYPFAIIVKGNCGRLSAAYPIKYLDIPRTQDKGFLSFCSLSYNASGMVLPEWADCVEILRGINLNRYELQWKVDKIETTDDGKLRLTIQSLNHYNSRFNFQSNTVYQYLKGDRVEFIRNGDGTIFTTASNGLLNYLILSPFNDEVISGQTDAPADFFNQILIPNDGRLSGLTEGAIIELQRPNQNTTETGTIYYGICASIPVENGQLVYPTGTFKTFDTYLVNRTIGSFIGTFEHFSPSDFWGTTILRISDIGKAYVQNQYETEKRFGRNITINSPTQANYFGDLVKRFNAPGQGDIIAMDIKDARIILAICENDNFIAESADDLVRVGGDGVIRAIPADQIISDPQPKTSGTYGCQYDHIGSIFFGDGYAVWRDINKHAYITHNYAFANDAGEGKVQSYFQRTSQEIETHNRSQSDPLNKFRMAVGQHTGTKMIYNTAKTIRQSGINNAQKPYVYPNDTICYHPVLDDWFGFASFTPERYSQVDIFDGQGCAFLSYQNSVPYIHPLLPEKWNEFYGLAVDEMVAVTLNKFPEKMKRALSIEVQSDTLWFSPEISTDNVNFTSEIPVVRWARNNRKINASFLFNKNSAGGLFGNNKTIVAEDTRGFFVTVLLIRDNTDAFKYGTTDNEKRTIYSELDTIMIKFANVEQSGFTQNV